MTLQAGSPGFIGREWIETVQTILPLQSRGLLPALLVGSGLKLDNGNFESLNQHSPGFIGREWIETTKVFSTQP